MQFALLIAPCAGYPNEDALVPFMWLDYRNESSAPETGEAYGELVEAKARCPTRLRFAGHFHDETLGLFYNRFRDYDPALGRYLQPDPLGHAGGINLFAYPANPLACVDLRGLVHKKASAAEAGDGQNGKKRPTEDGRRRDDKCQFAADPNAPEGGRKGRDDFYPKGFRQSTHNAMAMRHTREGKAHVAAHAADPNGVPPPPPVRANGGKGEPLERDQMTWLDAKKRPIDYYARDEDGNILKDREGRPITNVTYDHDPPLVQRYNEQGYNQTREQRIEDFNDVDKLKPETRSENSRNGGGVDGSGAPETYRQDQGPNFT